MNYQLTANLHQIEGASAFSLELFGEHVADREGYSEHKGLDAIRYYLMQKHGWLPREVRSMSLDDLRFALAEEMEGWVMPKDARGVYPLPEMKL